jgi:hypothetical protein
MIKVQQNFSGKAFALTIHLPMTRGIEPCLTKFPPWYSWPASMAVSAKLM